MKCLDSDLSIDKREKRDRKHEPEVVELLYEPRISLATKMAVCAREDDTFVKQVKDALDTLGTGLYCNTFSERGKRQNKQIQKLRRRSHRMRTRQPFPAFVKYSLAK